MSKTTYEVGIIGCGTMGVSHARGYAQSPRTEIVAAADFDDELLADFAADHGVDRTYESHEAMLEEEDLDIVSVCTWHGTHARLTIDACEANVAGVICEKPMATTMGETRDMLDAADRNDVELVVGHQRRFIALQEQVRELVQSKAIGDVQLIKAGYVQGLLNWGTHFVDLARYFLDDPEPAWVTGHVERETDRYERGEPIEDRCSGIASFADGTRFVIEMDSPEPESPGGMMQIYGSRGVIDLQLDRSATITNVDGTVTHEQGDERRPREKFVDEFVAVLDGDLETHRCDATEAGAAMEVLLGLYEAARRDQVIEFPMQTRDNPLELLIDERLEPTHPGKYDIRLPYESVRGD